MAKFIKLTGAGGPIWLNADNIVALYPVEGLHPNRIVTVIGTLIDEPGGNRDSLLSVIETPEQILALINGGVGNGEA